MSAIELVVAKGEPRADSRVLAAHLRNQHKNVVEMIEKYRTRFERLGKVAFKTEASAKGQAVKYALLNEDQCYFLLTLSRNSDHVVDMKTDLVLAFKKARAGEDTTAIEYLPGYHDMHDIAHDLAKDSENERFVHMNLNKLVNKTVGIGAGQRANLAPPVRSMTAAAQIIAARAMQGSKDHHDGYQHAKTALGQFGQLLLGRPG